MPPLPEEEAAPPAARSQRRAAARGGHLWAQLVPRRRAPPTARIGGSRLGQPQKRKGKQRLAPAAATARKMQRQIAAVATASGSGQAAYAAAIEAAVAQFIGEQPHAGQPVAAGSSLFALSAFAASSGFPSSGFPATAGAMPLMQQQEQQQEQPMPQQQGPSPPAPLLLQQAQQQVPQQEAALPPPLPQQAQQQEPAPLPAPLLQQQRQQQQPSQPLQQRAQAAAAATAAAATAGAPPVAAEPSEPDVLLRNSREAAAAACCAELEAMRQALDAAAGAAGGLDAVVNRVMQLAEQQSELSSAALAQQLRSMGLGGEQLGSRLGTLLEPIPPCAQLILAMVALVRDARAAGMLPDPQQQQATAGGTSQQQQQAASGGSAQQGSLSARQVRLKFERLAGRMAATPHAELHTEATSQAEVLARLQGSAKLAGRDWVLVSPAGSSPAEVAVRALQCRMPLGSGLRGMICAANGQKVLHAQPTDLQRMAVLGRAHQLLLQRIMEGHTALLQRQRVRVPWDPASPADQALYGLALGIVTQMEDAKRRRVGYYHSEVLLHTGAAAATLGRQRQASLAPADAPGCSMRASGDSHTLLVQEGFDPGSWPWQNCSAWSLSDQLAGAAAAAGAGTQVPILPGVTCSFGIATVAASLPAHAEDFLGGSVNMCWAGFKLWVFFPRHVMERWTASLERRADLMGKQLALERLLSEDALLNSCQLLLQPPGTLVVIAPGHTYHAVYAPGLCWAEASNHWHAVGSAAGVSLDSWLAQWGEMAAKCPDAWQERMGRMWGFFRRLARFPVLAGPVGELLGMQPRLGF